MKFYQSIADYYHFIFPLNRMQVDFVKSAFDKTDNLKLLDIGCGIGELSFALSVHFKKVMAIDLDEKMIDRANHEHQPQADNLQFNKMNMLEIENEFGKNAFDAIVCFGNTLVHLDGPQQILDFFRQVHKVLKPRGKFLLQIINYDRIIDHRVDNLPTIENEHIQFIRKYKYLKSTSQINFNTQLTIRKTGQTIVNSIKLYPLRKNEAGDFLDSAGFTDVNYYGNFNGDLLTNESMPLLVVAS